MRGIVKRCQNSNSFMYCKWMCTVVEAYLGLRSALQRVRKNNQKASNNKKRMSADWALGLNAFDQCCRHLRIASTAQPLGRLHQFHSHNSLAATPTRSSALSFWHPRWPFCTPIPDPIWFWELSCAQAGVLWKHLSRFDCAGWARKVEQRLSYVCKSLQSYSGLTAKASQFEKVINNKEYNRLGHKLYSYIFFGTAKQDFKLHLRKTHLRGMELPCGCSKVFKVEWSASMGMVGTGAMWTDIFQCTMLIVTSWS